MRVPSTVAEISCGVDHTCSGQNDGTARCWGDNHHGQLGNGATLERRNIAVAVSGLTGVAGISASATHTCSRQNDGTARCWGDNGYGQLGDGMTLQRTTPVTVLPGLVP